MGICSDFFTSATNSIYGLFSFNSNQSDKSSNKIEGAKLMSDKILSEEELEKQASEEDIAREDAIRKHASDLEVYNKLVIALDEHIIRFGRTSNIHDQAFDLKLQVQRNRQALVDWICRLC